MLMGTCHAGGVDVSVRNDSYSQVCPGVFRLSSLNPLSCIYVLIMYLSMFPPSLKIRK